MGPHTLSSRASSTMTMDPSPATMRAGATATISTSTPISRKSMALRISSISSQNFSR